MQPKFIAEISSNHGQDLKRCLELIDVSADVGCHAVKFQLFRIDQLFSKEVLKTYPEIRERADWELPLEFLPQIKKRCSDRGLQFGCTPFYLDAIEELNDYVDFFKIASYEILWLDLISECLKRNKPVICSTGMATLAEVEEVVRLASSFKKVDFALMHCNSTYPSPINQSNLSAIETMRNKFNVNVGWSDHSNEPAVIYAAALRWNVDFFEVHIDLDGDGAEASAGHCWLPDELKNTIETINKALQTNGNGVKTPSTLEEQERNWRADPKDGLRPLKKYRQTAR